MWAARRSSGLHCCLTAQMYLVRPFKPSLCVEFACYPCYSKLPISVIVSLTGHKTPIGREKEACVYVKNA